MPELNPNTVPSLDLDAYLARIRYGGAREPTRAVLEELHLAHRTHVTFENLDIFLGRSIRLDLESLQAKLVHGKRGGYCYEQNTFFAAVLERLGFRVTRLAARVRRGTTRFLPRTHMLLQVDDVEGSPWLADVGFGGDGPLQPVPLTAGQAIRQFDWGYRVVREADLCVLQSSLDGNWQDLYAFTLEPQYDVDFEVASHYVSTHPASRFVQTLTAQRATPEARYILANRELTVVRGGATYLRFVEGGDALLRVLDETFDLRFPPGTRFRSPVAGADYV
jgi:N-hydroxyarylamine O-acetyltransferase